MKRGKKAVEEGNVVIAVRRVFKIGNSLCISLPQEWVKKNEIKAGDTLPVVGNTVLKVIPEGWLNESG